MRFIKYDPVPIDLEHRTSMFLKLAAERDVIAVKFFFELCEDAVTGILG